MGALIYERSLIERGGGGCLFNFSQIMDRHGHCFCDNYMYLSVPQKSQKNPVSLEELHNRIPLGGLDLLHKVGWALGNESADFCYHPLRQ